VGRGAPRASGVYAQAYLAAAIFFIAQHRASRISQAHFARGGGRRESCGAMLDVVLASSCQAKQ